MGLKIWRLQMKGLPGSSQEILSAAACVLTQQWQTGRRAASGQGWAAVRPPTGYPLRRRSSARGSGLDRGTSLP